jgi:drug/metabolite transporter (DMT)-like permease
MGRAMSSSTNDQGRSRAAHLPSYRAAIAMNLVAVICWAAAPTFVKAISRSFPVNFQNFWRYLVSLAVLWPAYFLTADRSRIRADLAEVRRLAGKIVLIALVQYAFQFTYTYSLTLIYPGLMTLVSQTTAIFGVLLAVAFFPDERIVVRDRMFLTGAAFALSGALLVVLGGSSWGGAGFNVGVLSALASALAWALLGTLIRRWVPHVPPLLSISSVFTILVPLFLTSYAVTHRGFPIPPAPPIDWVLMVVSGLIGVGIGQSLFYRAVPVIGVATSTSIGLLIPLLATVISWLAFGERLSAIQIVGGFLLIAGSWFVIRLRLSLRS